MKTLTVAQITALREKFARLGRRLAVEQGTTGKVVEFIDGGCIELVSVVTHSRVMLTVWAATDPVAGVLCFVDAP